MWVDQKDYLELRLEFYDEYNTLENIMQCSDIKTMGGRIITTKLEMIPAGKKGQETVFIYNSAVFDLPLDNDLFSEQNMKKAK
jgi:uncharacterized protein with PIN domain